MRIKSSDRKGEQILGKGTWGMSFWNKDEDEEDTFYKGERRKEVE